MSIAADFVARGRAPIMVRIGRLAFWFDGVTIKVAIIKDRAGL